MLKKKIGFLIFARSSSTRLPNKVLKKIGLNFINQFDFKDVKCNWYELKNNEYGA